MWPRSHLPSISMCFSPWHSFLRGASRVRCIQQPSAKLKFTQKRASRARIHVKLDIDGCQRTRHLGFVCPADSQPGMPLLLRNSSCFCSGPAANLGVVLTFPSRRLCQAATLSPATQRGKRYASLAGDHRQQLDKISLRPLV